MRKLFFLFILIFQINAEAQTAADKAYYARLYYTCKVWGYIKYFHSEVASGKVEWDDALLNKITELGSAASDTAFITLMLNMLKTAGETARPSAPLPDIPDDLKFNLNLKWFNDPMIPAELKASLDTIKVRFRPMNNKYVTVAQGANNPLFDTDNKYYTDSLSGAFPPLEKRMLALFRYWNIINYFYPYKNLMDQDWDTTLTEFIPVFSGCKDEVSYNYAMLKLAVRLNDSHGFTKSAVVDEQIQGRYMLPFQVRFIENETVITEYFSSDNKLKPGDIIRKIDGKDINAVRDSLRRITIGSNKPATERNLNNRLVFYPSQTQSVLLVGDENGTRELTFQRKAYKTAVEIKSPWKIIKSRHKTLGYVDMGVLEVQQIKQMFASLWSTDGIIFDIRNYPNGTLWSMINYLFPGQIEIAHFTTPDASFPGTLYWHPEVIGFGDFSKNYRKHIYLLFDERTQSQAEYTVMGLEKHPKAVKIGSQTAGADGNVSKVFLPGGIYTYFTALGTFYPDRRPTQRIGIVPDILVRPTIRAIREGRDEVLQAALDYADYQADLNFAELSIVNYPNPFNDRTVIRMITPRKGRVALIIYNILGERVRTLFDAEAEVGIKDIVWNGDDDNLRKVPSGIYFASVLEEAGSSVRKIIFLK